VKRELCAAMARRFQELGVKPELEAFQTGDVLFANQLVEEGLIDGVPMYQFVLGVKWGAPANPETVMYMKNLIKPANAIWTAMGIARDEFSIAAQSVDMYVWVWKTTCILTGACLRPTARWSNMLCASFRISVVNPPHRRMRATC